ncbi:stage II sporulation protein M [Clostridium botulinum]|uniref:Stage II sporulation protein M n=1 Tax=Clostridium combesii TaxID=39481 RepID=A0A2G7HKM2_9CLOT|nr:MULTISPECIES: stage II sporulation protein M [Clostridium]MBD5642830.1 stage II sporulation protein M [Clostridium botulinum]MCJ8172891.1 stage II sporulation protein M [Clostridium botulinum]NFD29685.1 stage II sporulation protein M [Clostridium botulinum]NFD34470.1 stage II sporulation protein M [Clostridium botulinum]NFD58330.1 stage II sporulation protein M [Clostridium botulinum]
MENKFLGNINRHVQENFWLYIISLLCICTGIVLGIYSVKYMGSFEKGDLLSYVESFSKSISSNGIDSKSILFEAIKNNITIIVAIWFLGLTMIGIPVILIIDVIKGFTIGFTTSFIVNGLGMKGIWMSLLGVLPQNLIYIPCIIFASVLSMEFSIQILRDKNNRGFQNGIWVRATSYSFSFAFVVVIMFIGFLMESYITPNMIKLVVARAGVCILCL